MTHIQTRAGLDFTINDSVVVINLTSFDDQMFNASLLHTDKHN